MVIQVNLTALLVIATLYVVQHMKSDRIAPLQFHGHQSITSKHGLHQDDRHLDDLHNDVPLLRDSARLAERYTQEGQ